MGLNVGFLISSKTPEHQDMIAVYLSKGEIK